MNNLEKINPTSDFLTEVYENQVRLDTLFDLILKNLDKPNFYDLNTKARIKALVVMWRTGDGYYENIEDLKKKISEGKRQESIKFLVYLNDVTKKCIVTASDILSFRNGQELKKHENA